MKWQPHLGTFLPGFPLADYATSEHNILTCSLFSSDPRFVKSGSTLISLGAARARNIE